MDHLDVPLTGLEAQLSAWAQEALALRFGGEDGPPGLPEAATTASGLLTSLQDVRRRLDRAEELLARLTQAKGRVGRAQAAGEAQYNDAWDTAVMSARRQSNARGGGDFYSAREMQALGNTAAIAELAHFRAAGRLLTVADEALTLARLAQRGLSDLRQDHLSALRSLQYEGVLDR